MITTAVLTAALAVGPAPSAPPSDPRAALEQAFVAHAATTADQVLFPACHIVDGHGVCYAVTVVAGTMFTISATVDDVTAPVFVNQSIAPFGEQSRETMTSLADDDGPPDADEIRESLELYFSLALTDEGTLGWLSAGGLISFECDIPDQPVVGVDYPCLLDTLEGGLIGVLIAFDVNWVPHITSNACAPLEPTPEGVADCLAA